MIRNLKAKDKIRFLEYCKEFKDKFEDNYVTIERERKFLNEIKISKQVFTNITKKGDKCIIKEDNDNIKGILIMVGFSDKFPRKYVKCIADSQKDYKDLFDFLLMNYDNLELFMKLKKENLLGNIIQRFKFIPIAFRGKELLFYKNGDKQ